MILAGALMVTRRRNGRQLGAESAGAAEGASAPLRRVTATSPDRTHRRMPIAHQTPETRHEPDRSDPHRHLRHRRSLDAHSPVEPQTAHRFNTRTRAKTRTGSLTMGLLIILVGAGLMAYPKLTDLHYLWTQWRLKWPPPLNPCPAEPAPTNGAWAARFFPTAQWPDRDPFYRSRGVRGGGNWWFGFGPRPRSLPAHPPGRSGQRRDRRPPHHVRHPFHRSRQAATGRPHPDHHLHAPRRTA